MFKDLKFAHTREDPNVEIRTLESISRQRKLVGDTKPLRVVLICSGGCTVLSLLANSFLHGKLQLSVVG